MPLALTKTLFVQQGRYFQINLINVHFY